MAEALEILQQASSIGAITLVLFSPMEDKLKNVQFHKKHIFKKCLIYSPRQPPSFITKARAKWFSNDNTAFTEKRDSPLLIIMNGFLGDMHTLIKPSTKMLRWNIFIPIVIVCQLRHWYDQGKIYCFADLSYGWRAVLPYSIHNCCVVSNMISGQTSFSGFDFDIVATDTYWIQIVMRNTFFTCYRWSWDWKMMVFAPVLHTIKALYT